MTVLGTLEFQEEISSTWGRGWLHANGHLAAPASFVPTLRGLLQLACCAVSLMCVFVLPAELHLQESRTSPSLGV